MKQPSMPDTMYGLLEAAISDARSLSRRHYRPHYYEWHSRNDHGQCEICLSGSLVAGRLRFDPSTDIQPWMLPHDTQRKLETLNAMRTGNWVHAYNLLYQRAASPTVDARLSSLPLAAHHDFVGRRQFNSHLKSLEKIIPRLRKIEEAQPLD